MQLEIQPSKNKKKYIDARALVNKYLELLVLIPEKTQWTESVLENNPPAYYRLLQFNSMLKIFEVDSLESFLSGEFILSRDGKRYHKIYSIMKSIQETHRKNEELEKQGSEKRVHTSFYLTPKTKEQMLELADAYKKHFPYVEGIYRMQHLEKNMPSKNKDKKLDEWMSFNFKMAVLNISENISPESKTILINEAIEQYGCPDIDIYELDKLYKK